MEPIVLVILLGVVFVATLASPSVRGLLRAIFRRPRETSVIVEVDGKRVELKGPLDDELLQRTIALLRAEKDPPAHQSDTRTGAGGDSNE
ncbi:hypothetical protein ACFXKC_41385 [Streptomyces sp. NPDC059340]|uniref:hypothetical protein n=1 Tax=Streptomyces sp. NPDC059340 TaxID=3346806 RepID=UPI0036A71BC8